ncbi:Peptidase M23 [uncultured Caudovirales phage]|uniref:Peptidase M23 n=1 Tax=uncultured Caudovirales phage TaxID=2100421 RepID=A0A6J5PVM0_9CAUD|nr:Peptidase M23 [uncultured Caudovirales phage]CAB4174136.1 Peptidase M23 [uncultured Caudovirales phage]CAB4179508.1 Peptidase M23 [uncultured Caudovirales phage]CAB4189174.1 Peptidase M23 [uncultured Caudovirales phage]CAB4193625.1 Peptidase M23 [uncultured Caudovirales phage]
MSIIGNMKSLTTDVSSLIKQIQTLRKEVVGLKSEAKEALTAAVGVTQKGGSLIGQGSQGNSMSNSLAPVPVSASGGKTSGFFKSAMAGFTPGYNTAAFMSMSATSNYSKQMGAASVVSGAAQMLSAPYQMTMDSSGIVNRAAGYYQATLRSPGLSRKGVEAATFSALKGGITEIGGDAAVASILSSSGYSVGSKNYLGAAAQVGGAANYLGMGNQQAAGAVAQMQSGKFAANAYQYGITTMNPNGSYKSVGNIAKQIMTTFSSGQKYTAKNINESYLKGALGPVLEGLGLSQDSQQMVLQAMVDTASGKNPDLASKSTKSGGAGNTNPLDASLRINSSQTGIQMASEKNTLTGLAGAAATVETFNRNMQGVITSMALFKGYLDGVSGTNVGKGGKSLASGVMKVAGGLAVLGGLIAAPFSGGTSLALSAAGAATMYGSSKVGGGTPGYGSSFGGSGAKGGGTPNGTSANWMDQGSTWAKTGGNHLGADYPAKEGTPVYSKADGVVSGDSVSSDYGNAVLITHNDGYQTLYAHLSNKEVSPGDMIRKDQEIGKTGKSGNVTGPHLHFEVRKGKNNPVDPSGWGDGSSPLTQSAMGAQLSMMFGSSPTPSNTSGSSGTASNTGNNTPYVGSGKESKDALTDSVLRDTLSNAGFNGTGLENAMKIARAESGGRPGALNPDASTGDYSLGLFQVNMIGDLGKRRNENYLKQYGQYGYTGPESLYDPAINARVAFDISKGGTTWSNAWVNSSKKLGIGGGTAGYGASIPALTPHQIAEPAHNVGSSTSGQTVNITVKFDQANEQNAEMFAKRVEKILEQKYSDNAIGAK